MRFSSLESMGLSLIFIITPVTTLIGLITIIVLLLYGSNYILMISLLMLVPPILGAFLIILNRKL